MPNVKNGTLILSELGNQLSESNRNGVLPSDIIFEPFKISIHVQSQYPVS